MKDKIAKKILKMEKDKLMSKSKFDRDWELITALDLAIKALEERPQGEWIVDGHHYKCSRCGKTLAIMFSETDDDLIGCPFCLADMRVKDDSSEAENEDSN